MPGALYQAGSAAMLLSRAARLVHHSDLAGSPLPDGPCPAFPGTAEKEAVMRARIAQGRSAFHPDDLTTEDMRRMGYRCTVDANGAPQWRRPEDEQRQRAMILTALAALKAQRAG